MNQPKKPRAINLKGKPDYDSTVHFSTDGISPPVCGSKTYMKTSNNKQKCNCPVCLKIIKEKKRRN